MANKSSKIKYYANPAVEPGLQFEAVPPKHNVMFSNMGPVATAYAIAGKGKKTAFLYFTNALTKDGVDFDKLTDYDHEVAMFTNLHPMLDTMQIENHYDLDGIFYVPKVSVKAEDGSDVKENIDAIVVLEPKKDSITFHDIFDVIRDVANIARVNKVDNIILGKLGEGQFNRQPSIVGNMYAAVLNDQNVFGNVCISIPTDEYVAILRGFEHWYKAGVTELKE